MRRIAINSIKGTEILAKDLFSEDGKFILPAGSPLKPDQIPYLEGFGVTHLLIEHDEIVFEIGIEEKIQNECGEKVTEVLESYSHCGNGELSEIVTIAKEIMANVLSQKDVMYNVCFIREKSNSTYSHSINVCALSILIGIKLKLSQQRLINMAIGALLHDIGYAYLKKEYNYKLYDTCEERDRRELRKHVINGYSAVENETWIPEIAKEIILFHHEYCDGTGYPFHYNKEKLKREVRIVTICDEFDSRVYGHHKKSMKVHEVIEYIMSQANKKFDFQMVRIFVTSVAAYPIGTFVCTDKGEIGQVVKQNAGVPLRPVLSMKYDCDGHAYADQIIVDLTEELSVAIIDTVDNLPQ
ncbi:MAG: HD domain-containing protein [Lachnospiraceae bacterium]|nr:HD domain-containing protein [Lachnospiraceae bacterium]